MSRFVRFFLLTSAVAVTAVALVVTFYREHEVDRLIEFAEGRNVELARSFTGSVWPRFSSYVMSASELDEEELRSSPETRAIGEAMKTASAGLPVLKIKIYSLDGITVYSSEPTEIGENKGGNLELFSAALNGYPASKLTFRDMFSSFEGTVQRRVLVESYLPIRQGGGPVEGIIELYTDVSPFLAAIKRSTRKFITGFLLIVGLVYGMLFVIAWRADRTIKQQYADIMETNAALEHEVRQRRQAEKALKQAHDELEQRIEERTHELTEEIVERKRAEGEARRHRDDLAHFARVSIMGEMATNLAHELNQPLTVISGCAQFCTDSLRAGNAEQAKLLDALEQVAGQADRASKIIRRIRGFIKKGEPERRLVDVNAEIRSVTDLLRSDTREQGTEIQLKLTERLPLVNADPIQIQQVILNLAYNGIEAMNGDGSTSRCLTIHTSALRNGLVKVAVRDEGVGIAAETMSQLFDAFFTTKPHGLGMGLSISRSIVEAHGGRLWASSDGKTGSVFRFTMPAAQAGSTDDV